MSNIECIWNNYEGKIFLEIRIFYIFDPFSNIVFYHLSYWFFCFLLLFFFSFQLITYSFQIHLLVRFHHVQLHFGSTLSTEIILLGSKFDLEKIITNGSSSHIPIYYSYFILIATWTQWREEKSQRIVEYPFQSIPTSIIFLLH